MKIKDALDTLNPDRELIARTELMLKAGTQKKKLQIYKSIAVAASLLFIISAFSISGYAYYQTPQCYLDVDINPSIELGVNAFDRVVEVTYFNTDAQELIDESELEHRRTDEAVGLIVEAAGENGYIEESGGTVVSLALVGGDSEKAQTMLQECSDSAKNARSGIAVFQASLSDELKAAADAASMSAGKLNLIRMIQALDSGATVEEYKGDSIKALINCLSYLTSDENTGASEESKNAVRASLKGVTAQLGEMSGKSGSGAGQEHEQSSAAGVPAEGRSESTTPHSGSTDTSGSSAAQGNSAAAPSPSGRQDENFSSQGGGVHSGGSSQSNGQSQSSGAQNNAHS